MLSLDFAIQVLRQYWLNSFNLLVFPKGCLLFVWLFLLLGKNVDISLEREICNASGVDRIKNVYRMIIIEMSLVLCATLLHTF